MLCLDSQGGLVWEYGTGGNVRSAPTLAENGRVYFGSDDGNLHAVDADGSLLWKHQCAGVVDGSCLLLETGLVVCAGGSKLYGVTGTGAPAQAQWPTFRHDQQRTGRQE
ncbi:MAG: PQQ-like beta-propeller repeat protein [candidate division WOR-3 bacterium]|nr:MAG: PQQ-like beta-propeller repeat protein [candidate division WOR-3 bacterium]